MTEEDDEQQRQLRAVTEEIKALCDARNVGGVVMLVSEDAAAWLHVVPHWAAIARDPKGFRIAIRGSTPAGLRRTESTMHMLGTLRDMASDCLNLYGRLFRVAKSQIEISGGDVAHEPFGGGRRPDPQGGNLD